MKKKLFVPLAIAAVVAMGYMGYGAYSPQSEEEALLLENVEALTKIEGCRNTITCYSTFKGVDSDKADIRTKDCSPCGMNVYCESMADKGECCAD